MRWRIENSTAPFRLDSNAEWSQEGRKVTHALVARLLSQSVRGGPEGWRVEVGGERIAVELEDTPFYVIQTQAPGGDQPIMLLMNDHSSEPLDPTEIFIDSRNALYTWVRKGEYLACFFRKAVHQLSATFREEGGEVWLDCQGVAHAIRPLPPNLPRWRPAASTPPPEFRP